MKPASRKQAADEQAAYGALLVCPKDNNFVKLRDLGQDQAKRGFCLQEALAGRSCGCRSGDAKEDPLASLAIRLEQCQRLVQIFLVLARVEKWMGTRDQDYQFKAAKTWSLRARAAVPELFPAGSLGRAEVGGRRLKA